MSKLSLPEKTIRKSHKDTTEARFGYEIKRDDKETSI